MNSFYMSHSFGATYEINGSTVDSLHFRRAADLERARLTKLRRRVGIGIVEGDLIMTLPRPLVDLIKRYHLQSTVDSLYLRRV
jgi:hypothetical protein